ncbi:hypothetical protein GGI21_000268 [Coemansia aciculifera]|nr:hypothetical protein GGI21_000268 [Coemansia aciculifera]
MAILEVGSNDAAAALVDIEGGRLSVNELAVRLADTVVEQVELLRRKGFVRIYVVNMPPLHYTPIVKLKRREEMARSLVHAYNKLLETKARDFGIIDLTRFVESAIRPAVTKALSITDTQSFCMTGDSWLRLFDDQLSVVKFVKYLVAGYSGAAACDDPGSMFFFDPIHPSHQVHRLFGYGVFHQLMMARDGASPFVFSEENLIAIINQHRLYERTSTS